ncbi:MAG TPA: GNAT family protein [Gaiellaceae bacterium]|jgi:RimJ/RimL family protein N-acetyltransferase
MDVPPLFGLRLRTPRLELRLPTHDELVELREVAHAGVHPPEEMPFAVAWTDEPYSAEWVVAFHEQQRAAWRPDAWDLELGVWTNGELAGVQALYAKDFADNRAVGSGSWLGSRFQRHGIGTEMRAAVLELALRGLEAEVARSGAVEGNLASLRVSEKLGYRVVGSGTVAPRGVDVGHTDVELRREDWRPPFEVEIEGLRTCLPLFGVSAA